MENSEMINDSFNEGEEPMEMHCHGLESENLEDGHLELAIEKRLSKEFENCAKVDGHMKVFLRVRPISVRLDSTIVVNPDNCSIVTNAPESSKRAQYTKREERQYTFSRVFGPSSLQSQVFDHVAMPLLERFLHGESSVLFAYGMTNAGKTHTIQGTSGDEGIFPRLVSSILDSIALEVGSNLQISMLEIYQEKLFDLLSKKKEKLSIRDSNGNVEVSKLTTHPVASVHEAVKFMNTAAASRSKSQTMLNSGSSRSHAVYSITLSRLLAGVESSTVFHVVDLAGAERGNRTKASIIQQKEANNINTSLMQLWRCLHSMKRKNSESSSSGDIIPFRESKLTHLLMPLLGRAGLGGVAMVVCVNPQSDDYDETISILGNASLACKIREITDVSSRMASTGGGAGFHGRSSVVAPPAAAASASTEDPAAPGGKSKKEVSKKRRIDGGSKSSITAGQRDSTIITAKSASTTSLAGGALSKKSAGARNTNSGSMAVTAALTIDSVDAVDSVPGAGFMRSGIASFDEESLDVVKTLRMAIAKLVEERDLLERGQLIREREIRAEVCLEMERSQKELFDEIASLHDQLNMQDTHSSDVTKSCKKVRKKQLEVASAAVAKDLEEAEDEIERLKSAYDTQVATLTEENQRLQAEMDFWKEKAEVASRMLDSLNMRMNSRKSAQENLDGKFGNAASTARPAEEFSHRMQRDPRFNRADEIPAIIPFSSMQSSSSSSAPVIGVSLETTHEAQETTTVSAAPQQSKRSPTRSPLGPLRNDPNSPIQLASLAIINKPKSKRSKSPKKGIDEVQQPRKNSRNKAKQSMENDENAPVPSAVSSIDLAPEPKRLRSQILRV